MGTRVVTGEPQDLEAYVVVLDALDDGHGRLELPCTVGANADDYQPRLRVRVLHCKHTSTVRGVVLAVWVGWRH